MSCLNQFSFSFQLPAETATCLPNTLARSVRQLDPAESGGSKPVGFLRFTDQLLQLLDPVGRQPPNDHVLDRLHHFTFLPSLPSAADRHAVSVFTETKAANSQVKQDEAVVSFLFSQRNKRVRQTLTLGPRLSPGAPSIWMHSAVKGRSESDRRHLRFQIGH